MNLMNMSSTTFSEPPPAFEASEAEAITRRGSTLPITFESEQNRQLEMLGYTQRSPSVPNATYTHNEYDELPQYEGQNDAGPLPDYQERHLLEPVASYSLYQINRKLQVHTPAIRGAFDRPRYRLEARSGLFSKRADHTLVRLPTDTASAAETCPGTEVGFVNFDKVNAIPWMPRARVNILQDSSISIAYDMSAPNGCEWKLKMEGQTYCWRLTNPPVVLSLIELGSDSVYARFVYSKHGTDAKRGEAVGVLDIFGGSRSENADIVELVLCTVQIPILHFRNMGRHYKNQASM